MVIRKIWGEKPALAKPAELKGDNRMLLRLNFCTIVMAADSVETVYDGGIASVCDN